MPRSLVLGNGSVLATFDERLMLRDLYFPFVGMEDHTAYGDAHRVGFYVEGKGIKWLDDPAWTIEPRYRSDTLVGDSILRCPALGIEVTAQDYVHPVKNILVRNWLIRSTDGEPKQVRVFFHHDLHIYGDKQKDTAFYEPYTNSVIHFRQSRYFLISGSSDHPTECALGDTGNSYQSILHSREKIKSCGINAWSIGKADYRGLEGTWRDAEDGQLSGNTIEQGSVDSTVGLYCSVEPGTDTELTLCLCMGKTLEEVVELQQFALREGGVRMQRNCANYWRSWVNKTRRDFGSLPEGTADLYNRSLLLIRLHADNNGGIVAAADADIMAFNRDTYTYIWPRDGAFVSLALDRARYMEVTRRFFRFCARVQTPDGYLLHKYNPDGSVGSSWHPWFRDGEAQLPIQEDETALVLYALWKHFEIVQDFEFLQEMFETLVKKAAQFLVDFREPATGLPLPSYDPWEEHRGIFTYTVASVVAGLHAASQIAHVLGHFGHSERYQTAADEVKQALVFHLYDEDQKSFLKKIKRKNGETTERDATPDVSMCAVWKLGVLPVDDPRVVSMMQRLDAELTVRTSVGGWARYKPDYYHSVTPPTADIPGNPWILTTLWHAQWLIAMARSREALQRPRDMIAWANSHASPTGILPEQLDALTGKPLSVAPLTWSHATYVETVLQFMERERELSGL